MEWYQAVVLGIVEGVTEFLPISSTGHMILVSKLMGISENEFVKSFEIVVQLGAIAAVGMMYIQKVIQNRDWWGKIVASFVVTGVVGTLLYEFVREYLLGNATLVAVSLLVGGILLILLEKWLVKKGNNIKMIGEISYKQAATIGLVQTFSIVPGVSRSMATIFGGIGVGLSRKEAVEYSFLLAVPTMVAASALDLSQTGFNYSQEEYRMLGIGLLCAFVSAWMVVKVFVAYVQKHDMSLFGWYRILVGLLYLTLMK